VFASLSYFLIFDKTYLSHPKFLANQIRKEMSLTMWALPQMAVFTAPWFLAEVRGYSLLYLDVQDYGWWYMIFQFPLFLVFTDCLIYWIHRGLHHPLVYKTLHKPHHRWIVPTPFASHAFHPLDGYAQVLPLLLRLQFNDSPSRTTCSRSSSRCKNSPTLHYSSSSNSGPS
jgi:lathosterol oxidase